MTKRALTNAEVLALAAQHTKPAKVATEVIPPPAQEITSDFDPESIEDRDRLIESLVESGKDWKLACQRARCPVSVYVQIAASPDFKRRVDEYIHATIDLPSKAAGRAAVMDKVLDDGNAYALKMLHDTDKRSDASEEDQRVLAELRVADRRTLGRQMEANIKRLVGMLEVVRGRRYSLLEHEADGHEPVLIEPTPLEIADDLSVPYVDDADQAPDGE